MRGGYEWVCNQRWRRGLFPNYFAKCIRLLEYSECRTDDVVIGRLEMFGFDELFKEFADAEQAVGGERDEDSNDRWYIARHHLHSLTHSTAAQPLANTTTTPTYSLSLSLSLSHSSMPLALFSSAPAPAAATQSSSYRVNYSASGTL